VPFHATYTASFAAVCAAIAATILVVYLVRRPPLVRATKLWLLLGLGALPITVAVASNIQGYEETKERTFCGGCHVMAPYEADSNDPKSKSLASRHARNAMFGNENCYTCHADYGMFGTVVTKLGGMRHVYLYYTAYRTMPLEESKKEIHLRAPYPNANCMQCHSTQGALWRSHPDHASSLEDVRSGRVSCASEGCHGYAHPFTKPPPKTAEKTGGAP
jgi:cytochrome c-type protein NapC